MTSLIALNHLTKRYDERAVVDDITLDIAEGEIFVLVGTSGSGKTTTLKMINRLVEPTSGEVIFAGKPVQDYPRRDLRWQLGYVLQQIALFPTMTVAQNIAVIPEMKGWSKAKIRQTTDELLRMVDLAPKDYRHRKPQELSGGEQQRIGILRALASEPPVVLMDEPFSALDPISRAQLQDLVLNLHQKLKTTVIFVTHDMAEALKLGDRIGIMREGKLLQVATPEVIANQPANDFVADFFRGATTNSELEAQVAVLKPYRQTKTAQTATGQVPADTPIAAVMAQLGRGDVLDVIGQDFQFDATTVMTYLAALRKE